MKNFNKKLCFNIVLILKMRGNDYATIIKISKVSKTTGGKVHFILWRKRYKYMKSVITILKKVYHF